MYLCTSHYSTRVIVLENLWWKWCGSWFFKIICRVLCRTQRCLSEWWQPWGRYPGHSWGSQVSGTSGIKQRLTCGCLWFQGRCWSQFRSSVSRSCALYSSFIWLPCTDGLDWGQEERVRWLDGSTDSVDMNLDKLWEIVRGREAWHAAVHGDVKSWTRVGDWTTTDGFFPP